jgi:hypothetical protein
MSDALASTASAQRQSLTRLREKIRLLAHDTGAEEPRRSGNDLVQIQYALARRDLDDRLQADFGDRQRLTEAHLGVPWQSIAVTTERVVDPTIKPVLRLVARQLAEHALVEFAGAKPGSPPRWDRFQIGDDVEVVPAWASIYWDAGTVADVPLVLETFDDPGHQVVHVFSRTEDHETAKAYLDRLVDDARGAQSPYRGRLLKASWGRQGVLFEVLSTPEESRDRLILPAAVWEELDTNVHAMFDKMAVLRSARLGTNRGVLLAGPPGTGKTAACKVLAGELVGAVTAIFVDTRVGQGLLPQLYREISGLTPALVLLEDLDLIVGDREDRSERWALVDFLTVLDGLMTEHRDVVTVATTNDPGAIDAGVGRAGRFDGVIQFPLPDEEDRRRILEVYLGSLEHRIDLARVARETEGKTGADLREYVRSVVLSSGEPVATDDFIRVVKARPETHDAAAHGKGRYL